MIKLLRSSLATVAACGLLFSAASAFAAPKDYQITGNVSELTDSTVTIMTLKKETWGFARDTTTKLPEGVKVGDKVTVHYTMLAGAVDAKPEATAKDKKPATTTKKADAPAAAASPKP